MQLPENPDEYEILADRNLEHTLRDRLSKLKNKQCEFILCLENCRNPEIHEVFKQIACTEFGKCLFLMKFLTIFSLLRSCYSMC
jgi:hypothetical protein